MWHAKHALFTLATFLLLMFVIAGCASSEQGGAANPPKQEVAQEQAAAGNQEKQGTAEEQVRVVPHAMGSAEIKGTPQKVVTLYQSATDAALLLQVKPVGAVESIVEKPWYLYIREQMEGVTNVGAETQPNLEEIIALQPDLIIATKSRHEKIYDQLSAIAPTVVEEDHYHWKATLSLAAKALNKEEEEKAFMAEWDKKTATFKEKMGDQLNTQVSIVDFRADHTRIFYKTFPNLVLDDLGLSSAPDQNSDDFVKLTTKETIPQMDADVIFDMTSMDRDDGRVDTRKDWTSHQLWKNLRAVKNNRVYQVDPVIWTNGSGPIAAMKMVDDVYTYFEVK